MYFKARSHYYQLSCSLPKKIVRPEVNLQAPHVMHHI